jgi:hypothetical protein
MRVKATDLREGMWILHFNDRYDERIVEVQGTRDGEIKINVDYGNGGEPATMFAEPDDIFVVDYKY